MLPTRFGVNWLLGLGEEAKNRISRNIKQDGGQLGFPIGTTFAIFYLQVTPMLPTKFGVSWPFGSGEEAKNRFSRWRPWWPSWISDRNDFSYFFFISHPDASYQLSSQLAQGCRRSRLSNNCWRRTTNDWRRMTDDRHWLTTIAHHEHFVLMWANKAFLTYHSFH